MEYFDRGLHSGNDSSHSNNILSDKKSDYISDKILDSLTVLFSAYLSDNLSDDKSDKMSELIKLMKQSISDRPTNLSDNQSDKLSDEINLLNLIKKQRHQIIYLIANPIEKTIYLIFNQIRYPIVHHQSDSKSDSLDRTSSVETSTKEIGLTDDELAVKLNVNTNTVKRWRKGQTKPRGKNLQFLKQWEVRGDRWFLKEP